MLSVPAFLRAELHLGVAETVVKPASRNSTLLLAGALALVVLVLGETTLLTFARSRMGGAASSPQATVSWKTDRIDPSSAARAVTERVPQKTRVVARHVQR